MLYDKQNLFSENQAITADAASTNVVCLAQGTLKEAAFGTPIPLRIQVTEAFAGVTASSSLEIKIQTDDNEGFSSPTTLATTGAIAADKLVEGFVAPINFIPKGNEGYMRIYYDVTVASGESITKGKITAGIVAGNEGSFQDM